MQPVKVITVRSVDPRVTKEAVSAYIKNWVRQRHDAGETTTQIARSLGLKSHASIVQYLTPGHPTKISDAVQEHAAMLLFAGSRDRLRDAAVAWYEEQQNAPPYDVQSVIDQAVGALLRELPPAQVLMVRDVAASLSYQSPELATVEGAKRLLRSKLSDDRGRSVDARPAEVVESLGRPRKRGH